MMIRKATCPWRAILPALAAAGLMIGSAGDIAADALASAPPETVLRYRMPEGRTLTYAQTGTTGEAAEVMGQFMESTTETSSRFSFSPKGERDGRFVLGVTVEDMSVQINSWQGGLSPDMKSVIGGTFEMVLSPLGEEVDVSGAEALRFDVMGSARNLAAGFKTFFPDLPEQAVNVGDTWPFSQSVTETSDSTQIQVELRGTNTLEGFETVDGLKCARIRSEYTGTVQGTVSQQGADLFISGTAKGTDIWHFAAAEGLYVKNTSDMANDLTIEMTAPQAMSFPTTQTSKTEVRLVTK